jgi:hypothetical protein
MKRVILEIVGGFKSLLTGMRITLQQFFKKDVTVRYPHESLKMPKRYRGHVVLRARPRDRQVPVRRLQVLRKGLPQRLHRRRGHQAGGGEEEVGHRIRVGFHPVQPVRIVRGGVSVRRLGFLQGLQSRQHHQGASS